MRFERVLREPHDVDCPTGGRVVAANPVEIVDRLGRAPAQRDQVVVIWLGSAHAARLGFVVMSISLAR